MDPEVPGEETPEPTLNIDDAVQGIAESLHLADPESPDSQEPTSEAAPPEDGAPPSEPPPEGEQPPAEAAPLDPKDQPPDTWRKEAKEKWATADPVLRSEIQKREGDIAKFVADSQPAFGVAQAFEKIVTPYKAVFEKYNVNPWDHVSNLLYAHSTLLFGQPQQKVAMFKQLAMDAGIDVSRLGQEGADPANNPLVQHIGALQDRIRQLEAGVTGVTTTVQQARAAELEASVMAFAQDEAAHPFFWEVTDRIQHFIDTKAAKTLDEAYTLAVRSDPVVWQKMQEADAQKRAAAPSPTAAHAANARKAVSANVRASGRGRPASAPLTIDETLRETMAKINARNS